MMKWFLLLYILASPTMAKANTPTAPSTYTVKACEKSMQAAQAKCATLTVKESPVETDLQTIDLNILILPALLDSNKPPLFILAGGPGQAATEQAGLLQNGFRGIQKDRDIVFVDQRGTGQSAPISCEISSPAADLSSRERKQESDRQVIQCLTNSSANLIHYTTDSTVQDINAVRKALGHAKIALWGASYGTRVGLEYLRRYPQHTDSLVLDGIAPYSIALPTFTEVDSHRALDKLFDRCENEEPCRQQFPELRARWISLLNNLEVEPIRTVQYNPRTQEEDSVYLDHSNVSLIVRMALYIRDMAPLIPAAIDQASRGDFSILYSFSTLAEDAYKNISIGLHTTVLCLEDVKIAAILNRDNLLNNSVRDKDKLIRSNDLTELDNVCRQAGLTDIPAPHDKLAPIESDIPVLLLSGDFDPVTPPYWAEEVKQTLTNSEHYVVAGAHHGVSLLGCTPQLIEHFLAHHSSKEFDVTCLNNIQPLDFFIDQYGPQVTAHD